MRKLCIRECLEHTTYSSHWVVMDVGHREIPLSFWYSYSSCYYAIKYRLHFLSDENYKETE